MSLSAGRPAPPYNKYVRFPAPPPSLLFSFSPYPVVPQPFPPFPAFFLLFPLKKVRVFLCRPVFPPYLCTRFGWTKRLFYEKLHTDMRPPFCFFCGGAGLGAGLGRRKKKNAIRM